MCREIWLIKCKFLRQGLLLHLHQRTALHLVIDDGIGELRRIRQRNFRCRLSIERFRQILNQTRPGLCT